MLHLLALALPHSNPGFYFFFFFFHLYFFKNEDVEAQKTLKRFFGVRVHTHETELNWTELDSTMTDRKRLVFFYMSWR